MSTHLNLPARAGAGVRAMAARRAASVPEGKAPISLVRPTATGRLRAPRLEAVLATTGRTAAAEQGSPPLSCVVHRSHLGGGQFMTTPGAAFKALN